MQTMKGPAIFLAQFAGDATPFNSLDAIAGWAAKLGYVGVQIPSWDGRLFDLDKASKSKAYCDEVRGVLAKHKLQPTELAPPAKAMNETRMLFTVTSVKNWACGWSE